MNSFMISFRSYVDGITGLSEQDKIYHTNHWKLITIRLSKLQSDIDEAGGLIKHCCEKARIRPNSLIDDGNHCHATDKNGNAGHIGKNFKVGTGLDEDDPESMTDVVIVQQNSGALSSQIIDGLAFPTEEWVEVYSAEFDRAYWHSKRTGKSVWHNPSLTSLTEDVTIGRDEQRQQLPESELVQERRITIAESEEEDKELDSQNATD